MEEPEGSPEAETRLEPEGREPGAVKSTSIWDVFSDRTTWRRVGVRSLILGLAAAALGALVSGPTSALIYLASTLLVLVPLTFAQRRLADHTLLWSLALKLTGIASVLLTLALAQGLYAHFVWTRGATPPEAWAQLAKTVETTPAGVLGAHLVNLLCLASGLGIAAAIVQARPRRGEVARTFGRQYCVIGSAAAGLLIVARLTGTRSVYTGEVFVFLFAVGLLQGLALLAATFALGFADFVEWGLFRARRREAKAQAGSTQT